MILFFLMGRMEVLVKVWKSGKPKTMEMGGVEGSEPVDTIYYGLRTRISFVRAVMGPAVNRQHWNENRTNACEQKCSS